MKIVFFGLSISSAWGNGHASLLRGLFRALHQRGHQVDFFEKDTPYYASHRDAGAFPYVNLHLYSTWESILPEATRTVRAADAAVVTSYCSDGRAASALFQEVQPPRTIFYDMDTPVTFSKLAKHEDVPYLPSEGLGQFDLVLSYTGGPILGLLKEQLNARAVAPLYGWVDPEIYTGVPQQPDFAADLSYLGTYSPDRQDVLNELLFEPATVALHRSFLIGGAMYPANLSWPSNVRHFDHVPPPAHPAFYSSSRLTLNVTRASMAASGYCPSGRLFEAAACGTPILSDYWDGLDQFFEPGREILIGRTRQDTLAVLDLSLSELASIARLAKERTLSCHTADHRARQLLDLIADPSDAGQGAEQESCPAVARQ
jgi:spore maturation protein CgeB